MIFKSKKLLIPAILFSLIFTTKLSLAQDHTISTTGTVTDLQDAVYDVRVNITESIVWSAKDSTMATNPSIQIDNKSTGSVRLSLQDVELSGDWTPNLLHETYYTDEAWSDLSAKEAPNSMTLMLKLKTQPGFSVSYNTKNSVDHEYSISKSTSDGNFLVKNTTSDSIEEYRLVNDSIVLGDIEEDALIEIPIEMKAARRFREVKNFNVNFLLSASMI